MAYRVVASSRRATGKKAFSKVLAVVFEEGDAIETAKTISFPDPKADLITVQKIEIGFGYTPIFVRERN